MDKLSHLFVRRLRHLAARQTRRHALTNGLLELKIGDVRGHLVRRYAPAFDTSALTYDVPADLAWLKRTFGSMLLEPPKPEGDAGATVAHAVQQWSGSVSRFTERRWGSSEDNVAGHSLFDRRAYAVRLVGLAAPQVNVGHIATSMLITRAIRSCGMPLAQVADIIRRPAPIITMLSPVDGAQEGLLKLIELTGLIPAGPYAGATGDNFYDHDTDVLPDIQTRRHFIHFIGKGIHRESRTMKLRLATALGSDDPILAIAKELDDIPDQIRAAADLYLDTGNIDLGFVVDLLQAVYGDIDPADRRLTAFDPERLTLDDLVLALRPGRPLAQALIALRRLAARNTKDGGNEDAEGSQKKSASAKPSADQKAKDDAKKDEKPSPWKKDKPSGAEVIQPEPIPDECSGTTKPPVTVETLSGYGAAQRWALDLKIDLGNYCQGDLDWSEMSTKLLLSGPPGTGKTSFARALCNTLQVPLVVTSVSTWLQGGHLNDVIDKMARTFVEARAQAPSILFIDEIDGIGRRVDPSRDYAEYWNAVVNKLLELLDGAIKSEGVIVIGATNRPEHIDEAIKRSGRLETHIAIPRPDIPALAGIIAHHLGKDIDVVMQSAEPSERQRIDTIIGDAFVADTVAGSEAPVQEGSPL